MALLRFSRLQSLAFRNVLSCNSAVKSTPCLSCVRTVVYSESGALLEKPQRVSFGLLKVLIVVGSSVFVGGFISKNGAVLLEKYEVFVPDDDD